MIARANFLEALRSLSSSKQRSLLALIGIVIGIGSVIGMVSIGAIVQSQALKQFKDMGIDVFVIQKSYGSAPGKGPSKGGQQSFRLDDAIDLPRFVPSITQVAPYSMGGGQIAGGGRNESISILGVTGSFFEINKLKVGTGRQITDLDHNSPFCVIGSEVVPFVKGGGELLGKELRIGKSVFIIVGVLDNVAEGMGLRPGGLNRSVLIHVTTASRITPAQRIESIIGRSGSQADKPLLTRGVRAFFEARVKGMNVEVRTAEELIESMEKQMRLFTLLLGAIGSIALIVGGVGVMNVMLVSVSERRKEIGIRRALGAQREDIQTQFIMESVVLCLLGGVGGVVVGMGVSFAFAYFTHWDFVLSYGAVIAGLGVSTAVGIFFGFYPARQASRLDPITALRSE